MKTALYATLAATLFVLAACGAPTESPTDDAPSAAPSETAAVPDSESSPGAASPAGEANTPAAVAGELPGTSWEFTGLTITFYADDMLKVKGGVLGDEGLEGTYTRDGSVVTFSVGGQEYSGNFDGTNLTIDGNEAKRLD